MIEENESDFSESLDSTLSAAFDAAESGADTAVENSGQPRDEAGRFAPKEEVTTEAPAEVAELPVEEVEAAPAPPTVNELDEVLGAHREAWKAQGVSEAQAIKQLLAISDFANRDPQGFIQWYAQQRGVQMTPPEPPKAPEIAPELQQLFEQVPALKTLYDQNSQIMGQWEQWQQAQVSAEVAQMAQAKDESGNPRFPHFDAVRPHMAKLIEAGAASTLADAYEQAVWMNPQVRQQMIEAQYKAQEAQRLEAAKQAAAKAARASNLPVSRPTPVTTPARSIDDTLSAVFDRMSAA
jgi:hypothetical protein